MGYTGKGVSYHFHIRVSDIYYPDGIYTVNAKNNEGKVHVNSILLPLSLTQMASQVPVTARAQPVAANSGALRGKKRPGSPAVSSALQATVSKKKKGQLTATPAAQTHVTDICFICILRNHVHISYSYSVSSYGNVQ